MFPSISGCLNIWMNWYTGLISASQLLSPSISFDQIIGVVKKTSCVKLAIICGISLYLAEIEPNNRPIQIPFVKINNKPIVKYTKAVSFMSNLKIIITKHIMIELWNKMNKFRTVIRIACNVNGILVCLINCSEFIKVKHDSFKIDWIKYHYPY